MKYLKLYENHQSDDEIHKLCKEYNIENYTINSDGSIDVNGDVNFWGKNLSKLPLQFNIVSGDFDCSTNALISLEGSPKEVGGFFDCQNNKLESLKYAPKIVKGIFNCSTNKLRSLKGSPKEVGKGFLCHNNLLKTLKGCPREVGASFTCGYNLLETLEGSPEIIKEDFFSLGNKNLKSLEGITKRIGKGFYCKDTIFDDLITILKYNGSYVYYYTTHNKAVHRYGDESIFLPMFNRMLKGLKLDEVEDVKNFKIIKTRQEGEEYLIQKNNI